MPLIAYCCSWGKEERACNHKDDEGEAEEGERVVYEFSPVPGRYGALIVGGAKFLGGKGGRHD